MVSWQTISWSDGIRLTLPYPPADSESLVGVVFGGGIEDGKPRQSIQRRLDAGASLLETNKVRKLVLSGDNRFHGYNEPEAMWNYLVQEKGVPADKLQMDNAGRSTYETCERTKKVFGLGQALLVSESSHLPRAIYLCRSFGIEATGYASDSQPSSGFMTWQNFREIWARAKATINIHVIGEKTVLGDAIPL